MNRHEQIEKEMRRTYIERYFKKCLQIKGVENVIVFDDNGIPKESTFEKAETVRTIGLLDDLITKVTRTIQAIDQLDGFSSMRLRSKKFEILITRDDDLFFLVFQNAKDLHDRMLTQN